MKKNKIGLLLLVSAMATSMLAACSSNNNNAASEPSPSAATNTEKSAENTGNATPSNSPAGEAEGAAAKVKPVTFTSFVNYDWYTAPTWAERPHGQWITENLKVTLDPVQSNGAAAQKLNAMIVSNQLPDNIILDRGKDVERLQKAGKLVAIDPYLEKYPEFVKNVGEETLNMLRSEDGKLYQIPNWYINGKNGNGNAAYLVEKKTYKALGSPKLETWEDLEAYLKQVKEKFPNLVPIDFGETRDGADLQMIGMLYSGSANDRTPGFISPGSGQIFGVPNGAELTSVYQDQGFKDTALYASRLFREGLTSQDLLTQTRDQVLEKLKTGKIAVFGAYDSVVEGIGREANNLLTAKDPEGGYEPIWPVHKDGVDKDKVYPSGFNTLGWNVNVITTNAKDPEAIFSYMNWATSPEGQQILFFGPPGLFYDKVEDGVPIPNDAYINRDPKKYDELKIGEFNWYGNTSYVDKVKAEREKLLPAEAQDWTTLAQSSVSFKTSKNITEFSNLDPAPNSEEGIILQRLKDQYAQVIPKIIFAKSDEEVLRLIEETDKEAAKMGYDKVLKWKTNVWQQNLSKIKG
ncbi:ABC transporter substrate-binding protein [Bacillus sp. FJAT-27264]|uniref:extracellular solute-binding protein n=1 Tax=Paenibacillus sp. (strain DSM 101736 / FJAT-27264) TaxID=1850362 RepID=UPI000807C2D4|nr:extracellular solute-binding protein [Bacillus sp. FJAT-27264]OBZ09654.1 ABC transporter substrate-binding protein [Bacillus sp. FJAT-27264]